MASQSQSRSSTTRLCCLLLHLSFCLSSWGGGLGKGGGEVIVMQCSFSVASNIVSCFISYHTHNSIIGGSWHKYHFCRDKGFVATNIFRNKQTFVATKLLLQQNYVCLDKFASSILLSRQKTCFVATKNILVAAPANDSTVPNTHCIE